MGRKLTIFLLLPPPFLLSPSPSPLGTLWTRSRPPRAYLSKTAESALAARAKIRPPCTLKHRVQQEYNSLLVNALNRSFKSNLFLNNFKWLLTKLELSCVRNIIPRSKSGASKSRPRWAAHTRIGNVWEYLPLAKQQQVLKYWGLKGMKIRNFIGHYLLGHV